MDLRLFKRHAGAGRPARPPRRTATVRRRPNHDWSKCHPVVRLSFEAADA